MAQPPPRSFNEIEGVPDRAVLARIAPALLSPLSAAELEELDEILEHNGVVRWLYGALLRECL